ncbi:MAG: hypothetical protein MZV64_60600 [Ignavibacteriales bacterium]|nr:hypothetical protein [Ignavibacteriales bacterium]
MDDLDKDVDFYYTVRHREEALFLDEIQAAAKKNPRLKVHIRFSAVDGSLTVDEIIKNTGGNITGYHAYMCGPLPMIQAFERKFPEAGVPAGEHPFPRNSISDRGAAWKSVSPSSREKSPLR